MLHSQKTREINRVEKMHPCGDGETKNYCKPMQAGKATVCLNIKTPQKVNSPIVFKNTL